MAHSPSSTFGLNMCAAVISGHPALVPQDDLSLVSDRLQVRPQVPTLLTLLGKAVMQGRLLWMPAYP